MTSMTSCIVGKKIRAMGPGPIELFSFVVLAILMAIARGISEHMLTLLSSFFSVLHICYVDVQISRSISASPLDFEITRLDCIA